MDDDSLRTLDLREINTVLNKWHFGSIWVCRGRRGGGEERERGRRGGGEEGRRGGGEEGRRGEEEAEGERKRRKARGMLN